MAFSGHKQKMRLIDYPSQCALWHEQFNTWLLFEGVKFRNTVQAQKVKPSQFVIFLEVRNLFSEPRKGVTLAIVHTGEGKKEAGTGMDGSYSSECYRHLSWDNYWKSRRCFCPNYCLKEPSFSLSSFPSCRHVCVQPSLAKYFSENIKNTPDILVFLTKKGNIA